LFQEGSPVTEVRFGTIVEKKAPEKSGPVAMSDELAAEAERRSRRKRRRGGGLRTTSPGEATYSGTSKTYERHVIPHPQMYPSPNRTPTPQPGDGTTPATVDKPEVSASAEGGDATKAPPKRRRIVSGTGAPARAAAKAPTPAAAAASQATAPKASAPA